MLKKKKTTFDSRARNKQNFPYGSRSIRKMHFFSVRTMTFFSPAGRVLKGGGRRFESKCKINRGTAKETLETEKKNL